VLSHVGVEEWAHGGKIEPAGGQVMVGVRKLYRQTAFSGANINHRPIIAPRKLHYERVAPHDLHLRSLFLE